MVRTREQRVTLGFPLLLAVGIGLLSVHLFHAGVSDDGIWRVLLGIVAPACCALGLIAGTVLLWRREYSETQSRRVTGWCLGGASVLAVGTIIGILYQQTNWLAIVNRSFMLGNATSGGALVGFIVGTYDVRRRRAQARAEHLNQQLTVLNRVLRHDIRNQANVIHGAAELINGTSEKREHAETIQQHANELVRIGDRARMVEHLSQDDTPTSKSLDIVEPVEREVEHIEREYPAVEVSVSLPENERVYAHPLVDTVLENLLDNAVRHNDKSSPQLRVECTRITESGAEYVEVQIVDNGPGIPEEELAVFDRAFETQLDHSSGLGLWLVHWIVTESRTQIQFEENSPEGTRIRLHFYPESGPRTAHHDSDFQAVYHPESADT